ncbi:unnamed protein product [Dicrocoelium dendriticum]|nr:unnamed protein product [Dicrocoelium dendriticum]
MDSSTKLHQSKALSLAHKPSCHRSKRRRRVKPTHSNDSESDSEQPRAASTVLANMSQRRAPRHSEHEPTQDVLTTDRRSTWELPSLFDGEVSSPVDNDNLSVSGAVDPAHFLPNKYSGPDTYSDVLMNELRHPIDTRSSTSPHETPQRTINVKQRVTRSQRPFGSDPPRKRMNTYGSSLLSPGPASSGEDDIIHFCSDSSADRFVRYRPLNDPDTTRSGYLHSLAAQRVPEKQSHVSSEDIEEEDLLAPKLSIFAGSTTLSTSDGVILSGMPNPNVAPTGTTSVAGGSRRKSPVRPMQVLRTKSSTLSSANTSTSLSVTVLETASDNSPLVFAQSTGYLRGLPDSSCGPNEDISLTDQPLDSESNSLSVSLRLTSPSGPSYSSIAIHAIRDPVGKSSGDTTITTHSEAASTRVCSSSSRPHSSGSTKSTFSLSHTNHASGNRHRPSILKRGFTSLLSPILSSALEVSNEMSISAAGRTIGAYPQSAAYTHKANATINSSLSGPLMMSSAIGDVSDAICAGPTKLLQLVTSNPSTTQSTTSSLTASDKLFGRRSNAYVRSDHLTAATTPTVLYPYASTVDSKGLFAVPDQSAYRYTVLRGSLDGRRYLVLGNQGIFHRSPIAPLVSSMSADGQYLDHSMTDNESSQTALSVHIDNDACNNLDLQIGPTITCVSPTLGIVASTSAPIVTSAIAT